MLPLADLSVPALVRAAAQGFGDKPCVVAPERSVSFREFAREVADVADRLRLLGVAQGDRVAILDVNSLAFMEAMCALGVIGAVAVPLNYRQRPPEHRFQIEDSGARLLLANRRYAADAEALRPNLELGWRPIDDLGAGSGADDDRRWRFADLAGTTPFALCYTSGTTGRPKGAAIDQKCAHMRALKLLLELRLHPDDVMHFTTPMFHISCLVMSLMGLMRGATQAVLPQFELATTLALLRRGEVTFMNAVPTMLSMILDRPEFTPADFGRLRTIMYTAAPIGLPLLRRLLGAYRGDLVQFLGQTEDLPQTVLTPEDHRRALADDDDGMLASIGRPCMAVELKICDDEGRALPRGTVGELVTRGGTGMTGYWGLPEETARTLRDGWVFTGDLGVQDAAGYVTLAGRKKHMIIRGGENVYPAEVETVLLQAPGVRDGVVLGLPDERWGEIVVAVVAPDRPDPDAAAIVAHCRARLASYKCPERIVFREALPYNAAGKVLRHVLRQGLEAEA